MSKTHRHEIEIALEGRSAVIGTAPRPFIIGGIGPDRNGEAACWSPEELLLSALGLSFLQTFQELAAHWRLNILSFSCRVAGEVHEVKAGPMFSAFVLHVDVTVVPAHVRRTTELLELAKEHCVVACSLKPRINLSTYVLAREAATFFEAHGPTPMPLSIAGGARGPSSAANEHALVLRG